jgi:GAF domain-containing protein
MSKFEATGSLLPQPYLSTPRERSIRGKATAGHASGRAGPGEATYSLSTIRRIHALVLQSALDINFGAALERVVKAAKTITNSRHAQIFFMEKSPVQPGGLSQSTQFQLRLKGRGTQDKVFPCEGLAGICALENLAIINNRPHHDARFNSEIDWAPGSGVKTVACAPMTNLAGKVVGVIQVSNKEQGGYTEDDAHFLDLLARQAAVTFDLCIKNDNRHTQIRKTTTMLKGFVKLAGKASAAELAHKSGLLCKEVCGAAQASCFLMVDEDSGLTSWSRVPDGKADVFKEQRVPIKGYLAEVLRKGKRLEEADSVHVSQHLGSLYCPIVHKGKAIGILQARGSRKGQFSDVDSDMLRILSSMIAVLQQFLSRSHKTSSEHKGKLAWESIEKAVADIDSMMLQGVNCQATAVLFAEQRTQCFWGITPKGSEFVRLSMDTFPLDWVVRHQTMLMYPASESAEENPFSAQEIADLKQIAKRFLPNMKLESLLACPLMGSNSKCVAILLLLNKHNSSGPFESWVGNVALGLSSKFGQRLAATLREEEVRKEETKQDLIYTSLPALFGRQTSRQMFAALSNFVTGFLHCDQCWFFQVDSRISRLQGKVLVHTGLGADPLQMSLKDAGCANEAYESGMSAMHDTLHKQSDHSKMAQMLKYQISSAVAVPIRSDSDEFEKVSRKTPRSSSMGNRISTIILAVNKLGYVDKFSEEDKTQLEQLSGIIGRVMSNNQTLLDFEELQEEMKTQSQRQNLIIDGAASLHQDAILPSLSTPSGLVARIRGLVKSVIGASDCCIFLSAFGGTKMFEMPEDFSAHAYMEEVRGIVGHVIKTGKTTFHSQDEEHEAFDEIVDQRVVKRTDSALCVPLIDSKNNTIGAIELLNATRGSSKVRVCM